ncbi:FAD-dependent monooxygenase [Solihabitans fulvus]|uniref:FAD-dependent monooxygenase n=1 Tax=Solihabitans fulvus TaxID=1892852 RepID=A0A5B2X6L7_9PSEU|nr:NAD(P)/FAD-dependent oxidoreductase [Solihabitans fulvus]KAA2258739.1 FAD-dependent monooxygenase [Solihabitans fulvus]
MRDHPLGATATGMSPLCWHADVVIVGGAVAGASTAHALAALGVSCVLLERTVDFPELNRGDVIQPLSLGLLRKWGVLPRIEAMGGYPVVASGYFHRQHGFLGEWGFADLDTAHPHQTVLRHTNLHRALYAAFADRASLVTVRRGAQVSTLLLDGPGDVVRGVGGTIDGKPFRATGRVVVAADGAGSRLRRFAGIEVDQAHDYVHEYLMPMCPRPDVPELEHRTMRYVGAEGLTMIIPLDGGAEVRVPFQIPVAEEAYWKSLTPGQLWQRMVARAPVLDGAPGPVTGGVHTYRIHLRHAQRYVEGRICLVGDAAHVVPPTVAQGMNMAMLDADVLAAVIRRSLHEDDVEHGLGLYDQLRRPVNAAVLAASHEQTLAQAATGPAVDEHVLRDHAWLADPQRCREVAERVAGLRNPTAEQLGILDSQGETLP